MSEQIKMTEEQLEKFQKDCGITFADYEIKRVKEAGYIVKSNLEILIEECEEMYQKWNNHESQFSTTNFIDKLFSTFQAMKAELNKRGKNE